MTKKRELVERLLEHGMVMVTLDARRAGVDVPPRLRGDSQLRLNLSYRFGLALEVTEWGILSTLTFGGMPHPCKLPWNSIYQVHSHITSEQFLFPSEVPEDLLQPLDGGDDQEDLPVALEAPKTGRPGARLSLVPAPSDPEPEEGTGPAPAASGETEVPVEPSPEGGPRRGHLRRIK